MVTLAQIVYLGFLKRDIASRSSAPVATAVVMLRLWLVHQTPVSRRSENPGVEKFGVVPLREEMSPLKTNETRRRLGLGIRRLRKSPQYLLVVLHRKMTVSATLCKTSTKDCTERCRSPGSRNPPRVHRWVWARRGLADIPDHDADQGHAEDADLREPEFVFQTLVCGKAALRFCLWASCFGCMLHQRFTPQPPEFTRMLTAFARILTWST